MTKWTRESVSKAVRDIGEQLHMQHPEAVARLEQLDAHLATVAMVVDHIYDEAERQ